LDVQFFVPKRYRACAWRQEKEVMSIDEFESVNRQRIFVIKEEKEMQYNKRRTILFLFLALALAAPLTTIAATVNSVATIELSSKTVDKEMAYLGDELVYTIVLQNSGDEPMDVEMMDPLPMQVDYVSHTIGEIVGSGTGAGGTGSLAGPYLYWDGTLNADSAVTLTLTVRVNNMAVAGESIVNEASINTAEGTLLMTLSAETDVWTKLFLPIVAR
jgi:uncharacterized repeat protein (TIGR01451 family)